MARSRRRRPWPRRKNTMHFVAVPILMLAARVGPGMVPHPPSALPMPSGDRTPSSLSLGKAYEGKLVHARRLPPRGVGFRATRLHKDRLYGTDDLVEGLVSVAQRLERADPGRAPLAIGDLSAQRGGNLSGHKSHQNGRDADLGFFVTDLDGVSLATGRFIPFDGRGRPIRASDRRRRFDTDRNWALVKTILTEPRFGPRVQYLFVSRDIRAALIGHARKRGEDPALVARAEGALWPPHSAVDRHDGHFHLRIGCSARDKTHDCQD